MDAATVAVLVVDDQEPFRRAARALLRRTAGFELAGEAASGEEAVIVAAGVRPRLVIMDIRMPGMSGIEATRRLLATYSETVVVLCSTYAIADLAPAAMTCGAHGYVYKGDLTPELLARLWAARHEGWG